MSRKEVRLLEEVERERRMNGSHEKEARRNAQNVAALLQSNITKVGQVKGARHTTAAPDM